LHEKVKAIGLDAEAIDEPRGDKEIDGRDRGLPGEAPADISSESVAAIYNFLR